MLNDLLHEPMEDHLRASRSTQTWVRAVNDAYLELERHRIDANEIVRLKFAVLWWRSKLLSSLIHSPPTWAVADKHDYVDVLLYLRTHIPVHFHARLDSFIDDDNLFASLMAEQGIRAASDPDLVRAAGPDVNLNMVANRSSRWSFSRWKKLKEFSEYEFEGEGVRYRGNFFRPGDVLLANVNLDGNGVYTSLSDPKNFSSHSAFVAILQDAGRSFPAVIETYEKGVRAVPLSVFLGPRFSAYVEVYRSRRMSSDHAKLVNASALAFTENVKGYNFDSEDSDRQYMSCTSVGRFLLQDAGLPPVPTKSSIGAPGIVRNLTKVGYTFFSFFAPVDYLLDEAMYCVGWIDNNQFSRLLARELVDRKFREQFASRDLDPRKFPRMWRLNLWGIRHIRRQTLFGRLLAVATGFNHISLPKGPDELISVITLVESQLGKVIDRVHSPVEQRLTNEIFFDVERFADDPGVQAMLSENMNLPWLVSKFTDDPR